MEEDHEWKTFFAEASTCGRSVDDGDDAELKRCLAEESTVMMAIEVPQRLRQARRLGLVRCEDRHWLAVSNDLQCVMGQGTGRPQGRGESGES
jgi:hypothetical protein